MKKTWEEPQILVQEFTPNEYVASSCGDSGTVYMFECNAGEDTTSYGGYAYEVFEGTPSMDSCLTGGRDGVFDGLGYGPCGETHEASTTDDFLDGYMIAIDDLMSLDERKQNDAGLKSLKDKWIQVIIWTAGRTNVHCTTNLNMSTWVTAKS